MARQEINIGTIPNDGTGDPLRDAMIKVNNMTDELYKTVVIVNEKSDLPTPSAGVITLLDDTRYEIRPIIDLVADRIEYGINSEIVGLNSSISGLLSTTSSPLITCNDQFLRLSRLNLTATNSTYLIDFTGSVTSTFIIERVVSATFNKVAKFTNACIGLMSTCSFIGGTDILEFFGTGVGDLSIQRSGFTGYTGDGIDFGTATVDTLTIDTVRFEGTGASTGLRGLADGANFNSGLSAIFNTFGAAATSLAGITTKDLPVDFVGNFGPGVMNSREIGSFSWDGNTNTTSITADTYVNMNLSGAAASSNIERFSLTNTTIGELTYTGLSDFEGTLVATVHSALSSIPNADYRFTTSINGATPVFATAPYMPLSLQSTGDGITIIFPVSLTTSDTVKVMVAGDGTGADLVVGFGQTSIR